MTTRRGMILVAVLLAFTTVQSQQSPSAGQFTRLVVKLKPAGTLEAGGPLPPAQRERELRDALGPRWTTTAGADELTFYVQPQPATGAEESAHGVSAGAAWEQAYALRTQRDRVEYAEPLFNAPGQT